MISRLRIRPGKRDKNGKPSFASVSAISILAKECGMSIQRAKKIMELVLQDQSMSIQVADDMGPQIAKALYQAGLNTEVTKQYPDCPSRIMTIRREKNGELDEIVASKCDVHIERMDEDCWWIGIYKGGYRQVIWLQSGKFGLHAHSEMDDGPAEKK